LSRKVVPAGLVPDLVGDVTCRLIVKGTVEK
jgi:hypothetical protein